MSSLKHVLINLIQKTKDFVEKSSTITKIYNKLKQFSLNVFQLHFLTEDIEDLKQFSNLYGDFNHIIIKDKEDMMILYSISKFD